MKVNFIRLPVAVLVCQVTGVVGAMLAAPALSNWYGTLNKPLLTAPIWLFTVAWFIVYTAMGCAVYIVWEAGGRLLKYRNAVYTFIMQLCLNPLWFYLFFRKQSPLGGLVVVVTLWAAIVATLRYFCQVNLRAYYLLLPYLIWVSYIVMWNTGVAVLNW